MGSLGSLGSSGSVGSLGAIGAAGSNGSSARSRRTEGIHGTWGTQQSGITFIELLVVTTIILILASAIMPLCKVAVQREREAEPRRYLREMRTAIDKYKDAVDNGLIGSI